MSCPTCSGMTDTCADPEHHEPTRREILDQNAVLRRVNRVLQEVRQERERQLELWGDQSHPDGTSSLWHSDARAQQRMNERRVEKGTLQWQDILQEEVLEAYAETDPAKLRAELIQVAAVAVGWVEDIDRRSR